MRNRGSNAVSTSGVFLPGLLFLLALPATVASAEEAPVEAPRARAGQDVVFAREDGLALVLTAGDDPVIRVREVEGRRAVVRLTPMDGAGHTLGSGYLIVLGSSEESQVQLRGALSREALLGARLRVEVLEGEGGVSVSATDGRRPWRSQATASSRRSSARDGGPSAAPLPTSIDLIDQAEASGTLDGETALTYRVFALFGDARLPEQYRGDDSRISDSLYLGEVRNRFAKLSAETQALVRPFLIPPAYEESWANQAQRSTANLQLTCTIAKGLWGFVETANGRVRVWHPLSRDLARARAIALEIDGKIWPAFSDLMAPHLPLPDFEEPCNGGGGQLDIYLVNLPISLANPHRWCQAATPSSVSIFLERDASNVVVAHEIFHAFAHAYTLAGCLGDENYRWWSEATATWSQDIVYRGDKAKHVVAPLLLDVPEESLDLPDFWHGYGAYLLPFFLHRITGWSPDIVPRSWQNGARKPAVEALADALPEPFEVVWPEFVKANVNRPPVDYYLREDGMPHTAQTEEKRIIPLKAEPDMARALAVDLPRLSATYKHFSFDDSVSTVAFLNGVTYELTLEDVPSLGVQYRTKPAAADKIKGARVQALFWIRGEGWKEADWTNQPSVRFCRDLKSQRIDELILIISNSEFKDAERRLRPPALAPVLWISNMGCAQWQGTVTYDNPASGLIVSTDVTWKFDETRFEWVASGEGRWNFSGVCTGSGGSFTIAPRSSRMSLSNFTPPQGSAHRSYFASGAHRQKISATCQGVPHESDEVIWLSMPSPPGTPGTPGGRYLRVDESGSVMAGSHDFGGRYTWRFEAKKQ